MTYLGVSILTNVHNYDKIKYNKEKLKKGVFLVNLDLLNIRSDKINQFNKKGIFTIEDLVNFMPRKYYDFTSPDYIMYLDPDEMQATIGTIHGVVQLYGRTMTGSMS